MEPIHALRFFFRTSASFTMPLKKYRSIFLKNNVVML